MLGDKLMKLRRKSGMSQQDVATALAVSRQTISNWESGSSAPDIAKARDLATLYRISLDDLVSDDVEVTVAEEPSPDASVDLHVLKSLEGATCKIALATGTYMPGPSAVEVLEADAEWVRVAYYKRRTGYTVELIDLKSVAGFQIVEWPSQDKSAEQEAGASDGI